LNSLPGTATAPHAGATRSVSYTRNTPHRGHPPPTRGELGHFRKGPLLKVPITVSVRPMSGPGREAISFEVPREVNDFLEDISHYVGVITAWEDRKANRGPNDLSGMLVSHVLEIYGALQLIGTTLGSKCPRQVAKLIGEFRDVIEEISHYLWQGEPESQKAVVLHIDGMLFKMEIAMYTFALACVHAGPEDLADLSAEVEATPEPDN